MQGSAVFWWNLLKSGERDYTTVNVECPVLVGSKLGTLIIILIITLCCVFISECSLVCFVHSTNQCFIILSHLISV